MNIGDESNSKSTKEDEVKKKPKWMLMFKSINIEMTTSRGYEFPYIFIEVVLLFG
jgi:hypothetical protein